MPCPVDTSRYRLCNPAWIGQDAYCRPAAVGVPHHGANQMQVEPTSEHDTRSEELVRMLQEALHRVDAIDGMQQVGIHICHAIELIEARMPQIVTTPS